VAVAVALAASQAGPASARVGVAIEPGEVSANAPIPAGTSIDLPIIVTNIGDEEATYRMRALPLSGTPDQEAQPDWFSFWGNPSTLGSGSTLGTVVTITPSSGTTTGRYAAIVRADIEPTGQGTDVQAAETRVFFDVTAAPPDESRPLLLWGIIAAVLVVVLGAAWWLRRARPRRALVATTTE